MANYIKKVGKLLGVEVGEVFQVDGDPSIKDCFFKFSDNDLQLSAVNGGNDTWTVASGTRLLGILYGRLRIRKLPWKPTKGQKYYVLTFLSRTCGLIIRGMMMDMTKNSINEGLFLKLQKKLSRQPRKCWQQ